MPQTPFELRALEVVLYFITLFLKFQHDTYVI